MKYKPSADFWLLIAYLVFITVIIFGCSSSRKTTSKQSTLKDSTSVSTTTIEAKTDVTSTKKIDSTGISVKDNSKTFSEEIEIDFDSTEVEITRNGTGDDYTIKGKIKSIKTKRNGQIVSKETTKSNKTSIDSLAAQSEFKGERQDSTAVHSEVKSLSEVKKKTGLWESILNKWWLWLLLIGGVVAYWKRGYLKGKMFGSTKG